jgi:hypothetical protein
MTRIALAVAHPSHELRVYGWISRVRPTVYVLTDGSGRAQQPRLDRTTELLDGIGITPGAVYGRVSDIALYDLLLHRDVEILGAITRDLADDLLWREIDIVAGDSTEGYSSVHDVWRLMVNAAVALVRRAGRTIENREFAVVAAPRTLPDSVQTVEHVVLDDAELALKLAAVRAYNPALAAEVDAAMAGERFQGVRRLMEPYAVRDGDASVSVEAAGRLSEDGAVRRGVSELLQGIDLEEFRHELFWNARPVTWPSYGSKPYYESYGEELVRAGHYAYVIRQHEHLRPIGEALMAWLGLGD